MKKVLAAILVGCVFIGVGAGVTAFEMTNYEFVENRLENNNVEIFTVPVGEETSFLFPYFHTGVDIVEDKTLSGQVKVEVAYRGEDGDLKLREERSVSDGYSEWDFILYDRGIDYNDWGKTLREFMDQLKDRKIMMYGGYSPMEIILYVNPADRDKIRAE